MIFLFFIDFLFSIKNVIKDNKCYVVIENPEGICTASSKDEFDKFVCHNCTSILIECDYNHNTFITHKIRDSNIIIQFPNDKCSVEGFKNTGEIVTAEFRGTSAITISFRSNENTKVEFSNIDYTSVNIKKMENDDIIISRTREIHPEIYYKTSELFLDFKSTSKTSIETKLIRKLCHVTVNYGRDSSGRISNNEKLCLPKSGNFKISFFVDENTNIVYGPANIN